MSDAAHGVGTDLEGAARFAGLVDQAGPRVVAGWVVDRDDPSGGPLVQLELDGMVVASQRSDGARADAEEAETCGHGFRFELGEALHPETRVDVRLVAQGTAVAWAEPRAYLSSEERREGGAAAKPAPMLTPRQRETMLTLALHGTQVAAAMEEWPVAPPTETTADGLLLELMMRMATAPRR